ncbi:hypothetical protein AB0C52_33100 [Streptomyces sp. NPDC048717]|uniref:hypothetical protein n=1 Tax=Streptomyces sp. NPDC048717 TaxID=3154928 RepID=UPI00344A73D0
MNALHLFHRWLPTDPAAAKTAADLAADLKSLRRVSGRRTTWSAGAVEDALHHVYGAIGPWLKDARSQLATTDSPADRARWAAWIAALTPPEHIVKGTFNQVHVLVGTAREMLRALQWTLDPCLSVGSVAKEIERLIGTGELAPATKINQGKLAQQLKVPIEYVGLALADLGARGLVELSATGRAKVPRPNPGNRRAVAVTDAARPGAA